MKLILLPSVLLFILLSGCAAESPSIEPLQDAVPEDAPAEEVIPEEISEAAVTINSLTCVPSPPPPDSAYCANCHYYKIDWNGTAQGPVGSGIQADTNLGYSHRSPSCGMWEEVTGNCIRRTSQPLTTIFIGGIDYAEMYEGFEFILGIQIHGPGFDPIEVEKLVICS